MVLDCFIPLPPWRRRSLFDADLAAEAASKTALWALAAALLGMRAIVFVTLELSTSNYLQ
jgi:hypothetical protein